MFAGIISKEQPVSAWGDATKIMAALAPYSLDKPRDHWATDRQMLLQVATHNDASTAEIYKHPESGVAVAFWGRLDNRPDLIAQLNAEHKASDDELIALAWLKWGEYCPEKLIGDFAFAVASPKTGVVFLARDVMGVKPLYYRVDEHGVFFANTAAAFKPLSLGTLTRSKKWMAEYMLEINFNLTDTAYVEIKKLAGAHSLLFHADGRLNLRRYHRFVDNAPIEKKRNPLWLEAYRAAWQDSVACRLPKSGAIGSENSGGLDSGSITSELARQLGDDINRLHCFSLCYEEMEPALIMATARKFGIRNNFIVAGFSQERYKESQLRQFHVNGYPLEHNQAVLHYPFYQECNQKNIATLYSGFGGDQVVTSESEFAINEYLSSGDYLNAYRVSAGNPIRKLARTAYRALKLKKQPTISQYSLKCYKDRWTLNILEEQAIEEFQLESRYLGQSYCQEYKSMNKYSLDQIELPYHQTRMGDCTLIANSYNTEYVWPMWDQRLVQQWLDTPTVWKVGEGGILRYLHKCAISSVCPDDVTWKSKKDMGFSQTTRVLQELDNKPYFDELIRLSEELPLELSSIIDVEKIKAVAYKGISENLRGLEVYFSIKYTVEFLSNLSEWLRNDTKK